MDVCILENKSTQKISTEGRGGCHEDSSKVK